MVKDKVTLYNQLLLFPNEARSFLPLLLGVVPAALLCVVKVVKWERVLLSLDSVFILGSHQILPPPNRL